MTTAHRTTAAAPAHVLFSAIDQRHVIDSLSNITGVQVIEVGNGNDAGSGTLYYRDSSGTDQLAWKAPGDSQGSWVDTTTDGAYDLVSDNGYARIRVYVDNSALPGSDNFDTVTVTAVSTGVVQPPSWETQPTNITGA